MEEPFEAFHTEEDFTAIIFAKLASETIVYVLAKMFSVAKLKVGDAQIWCKTDVPSSERVALSLQLGL